MRIVKLNDNVKLPTKSHELDCGLDLYLVHDVEMKPLETICLDTGMIVHIPEGYAGI